MGSTLLDRRPSREVLLQDLAGPKPLKASLKSPTESCDFGPGPMIWEALVSGHGSVKATALTMGEKDASQIRRQVVQGTLTLKELFGAEEAALCEFAEYVLETFRPARKSKKQLALEQLPAMFQVVLEGLKD